MQLALSGRSALAALRALRADKTRSIDDLVRGDLPTPDPAPAQRMTRRVIESLAGSYYVDGQLEVAVARREDRVRTKDVSCSVHATALPEGSYLELGDGLWIPCPELLFVEMGPYLSPVAHQLLGMELCGGYAKPDTYLVPPVTSAEKVRDYIARLRGMEGLPQARLVAPRLIDNAWSPREAIIALLTRRPTSRLGYGMPPIVLNSRMVVGDDATRVPDIMFAGTPVGINYEGEGHLDLGGIVSAATEAVLNPGSPAGQRELDEQLETVRGKYADDQRRNRDLLAEGLTVFTVTNEDLLQEGGLDSVMLQCMTAIKRAGGPDLSRQRHTVLNKLLAHKRQLLIWSLRPGQVGEEARAELEREMGGDDWDESQALDAIVTW